jgi:hypothetical protein
MAMAMVRVGGGDGLRAGDDAWGWGGVLSLDRQWLGCSFCQFAGKVREDRVWVSSKCLNCGYGYGKGHRKEAPSERLVLYLE